jgi:hypothetical protein
LRLRPELPRGLGAGFIGRGGADALKEAGFEPNKWQGKSEVNFIFEKFIEAMRHCKRIPASMDLRMYGRTHLDFPNEKTFHAYFGSKAKLLANLRNWVADKPEYNDVADILGAKADEAKSSRPNEGLVYLVRSGLHYKIGRSDQLERRMKEIRIALPEAATLVHSIRTDVLRIVVQTASGSSLAIRMWSHSNGENINETGGPRR